MDCDLPDSILWFIFNKLSLKDQVKTSLLSKHWLHEWKVSSTHLNFNLYNTLHSNTLPKDLPLFRSLQSQFTSRLDQSVLNYQHATVSSIRVKFPLGDEHSDVIGRLIYQGIAKGVKHIELLFSHETNDTNYNLELYRFSFSLLSNADSLTYLHLENCLLVAPTDFSGLKNLRTLVLQLIVVWQHLLESLFSNCIHLVDFTLDNCNFYLSTTINSPTLIHLKIVSCSNYVKSIDIVAPNLASLEYSWKGGHKLNVVAHRLSRFIYRGWTIGLEDLSSLTNLTTIVLDGLHLFWFMQFLFEKCLQLKDVTFKNGLMSYDMEITSTKLLHLKIIDCRFESRHNKISIDAENLSSFEYSGLAGEFSIKAPKLSKVFWNAVVREKNPDSLGPIPELHQIENLAIITSYSHILKLKVLARFQNLRQLELFIDEGYYPSRKNCFILDVLMASQHLQKLLVTIKHTYWLGSLSQRKCANFVHNELKYVELHGHVSTPHAIEFARSLLRNVSSLKKVTFSSMDKFYVGAETWTKSSDSFCEFDGNYIYESLKDEIKGQCELIIL
ncbi:F-box/FBD/LRR-repeat protein At1g78750-like [Vicia villosa]|uniref:F-box/FBD/LRR-repeat protein At1g78750-like n=1 Tax=Vicia villosa TaxID=3911 RepID=UPI00273C366F|nr:F-box/FBD/LRR-repeat protein At1g78750-like [Vicia villosa]